MAVRTERFALDLARFSTVALDSAVLIYHLDGTAPYSQLTEVAVAAIASGSPEAVLSTVSVTELLVKPFTEARGRVADIERFLISMPHTAMIAPTFPVAREAARLRARYGLRTPDALVAATARTEQVEALVTNDAALRRLRAEGLAVLVLDDYV